MTPFPWREAMQFGFGVLRLSSQSFWGLTPRELSSAFSALSGPRHGAPDRRALDELLTRYPDQEQSRG